MHILIPHFAMLLIPMLEVGPLSWDSPAAQQRGHAQQRTNGLPQCVRLHFALGRDGLPIYFVGPASKVPQLLHGLPAAHPDGMSQDTSCPGFSSALTQCHSTTLLDTKTICMPAKKSGVFNKMAVRGRKGLQVGHQQPAQHSLSCHCPATQSWPAPQNFSAGQQPSVSASRRFCLCLEW
jgi:hypothetical protein